MSENSEQIKIEELKELCLSALSKAGVTEEHAEIITDHYMENECSGKSSHGMVRTIEIIHFIGKIGLPTKEIELVHDNKGIAVFESHYNFGPVAALHCMKSCIE
ncbi:MAG: Ldh family oxidoreductase, partial [Pseudomonadota bacterium]